MDPAGQSPSNIMENNSKLPLVSVVVLCRNEVNNIRETVLSILEQSIPDEDMELLVADGMSTDGTREILKELAEEYPQIRVLDNHKKITPAAMNLGINESRGKYVAIMGGHAEYSPDYLKESIKTLERNSEVACAGGPVRSKGKTAFGMAVAEAMSHPVGIGNATHRHPDYEGYGEGVAFPVFRKDIFDKIGLYDENLVRNQDDELNYRLKKAGAKVYLTPHARVDYYVRETPLKLFHQYFQYGFWRVIVMNKHKIVVTPRHLAPIGFFTITSLLLLLGKLFPRIPRWISSAPLFCYISALGLFGFLTGIKRGWKIGLMFIPAVFILHFSYAAGFAVSWLRSNGICKCCSKK